MLPIIAPLLLLSTFLSAFGSIVEILSSLRSVISGTLFTWTIADRSSSLASAVWIVFEWTDWRNGIRGSLVGVELGGF
eukprot:gene2942-5781_t